MAKLYLVVVISLLFSLANGQKFQLLPKQTPLEGVLGGNLTMTWEMVNVPDGKGFLAADLYMDFDQKKLLLEGRTNPARQNYATERFGNRISANITVSPPKYEVTLTKLQYNDAGSFSLKVVIDDDGPPQDTKVITISRIKDPKKPGGGDPKKPGGGDPKKPGVGDPEEGSNTGAIVGGVIGGIVCVALIVLGVLYFLRWKKNRGSSDKLQT